METVKEKLAKLIENGKPCPDGNPFDEEACLKCRYKDDKHCDMTRLVDYLIQNGVTLIPETGIGDMSDGYHTFNELYHHRALLFATICNMHPDKAWKAKKHDDGSMYDGMFIVGIETASGQATYHYDIEPYWDMFHVRELEKAPVWDGHTPEEALQRITTLQDADKWVSVDERLPEFVKVEKYGDLGNVAKSVRVLCSCLQKDGKQMVKEGYCQRWLDGSGAVWWKIPGTINKVTHWMPLPEPPKGVQ